MQKSSHDDPNKGAKSMAKTKKKRFISEVQFKQHMERWKTLWLREEKRKIAALAERGLPPRPRENTFHWGCESFSISLRRIDGDTVGVVVEHAAHDRHRPRTDPFGYLWGAAWPDYDQPTAAKPLLAGLAKAWPVIARPFLTGRPVFEPGSRIDADLAALADDPGLPLLRFVAEGPGLRIEHARGIYDPKAESLIVVECLLAFGDKLAGFLPGTAEAARWSAVRGLADVFPWSDDFESLGPAPGEDEFYAAKFGLDLADWEAFMLHRMVEWYLTGAYVPLPDFSGPLPDISGIEPRLAEAAAKMKMDPDEFRAMLRREFRIDCRAELYYKKWPEKRR